MSREQAMPDLDGLRWQESLILGIIWAAVGAIFSSILVAMLAFLSRFQVPYQALGLAAACAGGVGALFYGSLRLALFATLSGLAAAFAYMNFFPMQVIHPQEMLYAGGAAGILVGGYYGYLIKGSRVCKAAGKILSGLVSGFGAGIPIALLAAWLGELRIGWATLALTPMTGLIYLLTVNHLGRCLRWHPPAFFSGAVVGGGIAGLVGVAVWAFVGTFSSTVTGAATGTVRLAWDLMGEAIGGGMVGGFSAGALLGALGVRWPADRY